ncbi:hypothetical protein AB0M29_31815 [Streptomyces sp. NPDC051976]|uniref:hypothetical protein n=1 Tax=Streptomyces sp. NPDC051976 TaxID=3154947 RepID=UPI003413AAA1
MTAELGEQDRVFVRYARLWAFVTMTVAAVSGLALILAGAAFTLSSTTGTALAAVGESVIASVLLYVLVSLFLDPVHQRAQSRQIAGYAIQAANAEFQRRFEAALPQAVFASSDSLKPSFRVAFYSMLSGSTRYDVKGSSARVATFRLAKSTEKREFQRLDQIRFCLIDPRDEDRLRCYAHLELKEKHRPVTNDSVRQSAREIRRDVFVSLVALHDIRDALPVTVYFHRDLPFFRCEMFDGGMFLTYYLDGVEFPESLQFSHTTRPYRAYQASLELTRRFAAKVMVFNNSGASADLVDGDERLSRALAELGCEESLDALRGLRDERFQSLEEDLRRQGLRTSDIL